MGAGVDWAADGVPAERHATARARGPGELRDAIRDRQHPRAVADTAKQALTIALDVFICAGRDGKPVYINSVFQSLARRWSPLFRGTPGGSIWNKKPETLTRARTEMLDAGVDLAKVWTATCDGIESLYSVSTIGGPEHARGRSVDLIDGMALEALEKLILADLNYKRPAGRRRVLLADAPAPLRIIDRETVCERNYDVVTIGEPTQHVLQLLESARLFIDVERVRKDVDTLRAAVAGHAWAKLWANWKRDNALPRDRHAEAATLERWIHEHPGLLSKVETAREAHRLIQKLFVSKHRTLKKEYGSLLGRLKQADSVLHRVDGAGAFVEVKTGYGKVRNRRFQARHFWPTEASVKRGLEPVVLPLEATRGWTDYEIEEPFTATTSPRGRWFWTRAWEPDNHRLWNDDAGGTWEDDFAGPMRPLVGVDMSASMYQIVAVVTGDHEAEHYLRDTELKPALFAGLRDADDHGFLQHLSDAQARASMGVLQNIAYGQRDMSILKKLKSDSEEYGSWRDVSLDDFRHMLKDARKISKAVEIVLAMRDSYLPMARALAEAAQARDPKIGIRLLDPFDGHAYILNQPITETITLPHAATPLAALVPVGDCPNWHGRLVQARVRKDDKWVDAVKKDGTPKMRRVDTKGSIYTSLAPVLVHALDAAYAAHVILKLHESGVRDFAVVHDCFLVPSDAYPLLINALEDAARPWFEGLEPFYKTFEEYLPSNQVVALWRSRWEARRRAGDDWPKFRFKGETTVEIKFQSDDSVQAGETT